MADLRAYKETHLSGSSLENRLTTMEMWVQYLNGQNMERKEDTAKVEEQVDRIRSTAFWTIMSIAGSAILLLVNIMLGKLAN